MDCLPLWPLELQNFAIGKSIQVITLLDQLYQKEVIKTRPGIGGTHIKVECVGGIIPDFTSNKWYGVDRKIKMMLFAFSKTSFPFSKISDFDEQIASPSILSGSNIIVCYLNMNDKKITT